MGCLKVLLLIWVGWCCVVEEMLLKYYFIVVVMVVFLFVGCFLCVVGLKFVYFVDVVF